MRVLCVLRNVYLEGDNGREVDGVEAKCSQCGHIAESFGDGEDSRRRCLVVMREECPLKQNNFYVDNGGK